MPADTATRSSAAEADHNRTVDYRTVIGRDLLLAVVHPGYKQWVDL